MSKLFFSIERIRKHVPCMPPEKLFKTLITVILLQNSNSGNRTQRIPVLFTCIIYNNFKLNNN